MRKLICKYLSKQAHRSTKNFMYLNGLLMKLDRDKTSDDRFKGSRLTGGEHKSCVIDDAAFRRASSKRATDLLADQTV